MPWIKVTLTHGGYFDPRTGKSIPDVTGMKNMPNIDPFECRGKVYPKIDQKKVAEWREKGMDLLVHLDATLDEAQKFGAIVSDTEAEDMKRDVFDIIKAESGVTK